ncbi:MAG TPA: insulinase family protein, partial [Thermoanaerobaculia bacterium]
MLLEPFLQYARRTTLPNRLTLITREERGCGVVAINTWVKAGYFHEPDEVAGMAHLFEHMFFKGSKHFPGSEEIAQHVSRLGGTTNAGTIYDSTNYYFVLPKEGFARGVEIQADAIRHPLFDPGELQREAEVVIEESNRKLDNPPAIATERMYAIAFTQHRMKRWRIGSHDVLRNIRRENLLAFFETLYRPENIIVAIAGDVSHDEAIEVVARAFGPLPEGILKKERGPAEPGQSEFRYGESFADIKQSYTAMGWHTPGEGSADEEPLDVLSTILGGGRYSRLYRNVVGAGGANTVTAFNTAIEDVGIFTVRLSYDDANLHEVERRTIREIERLRELGPTEFEVALAKNRIEASFVFELEEVLGQTQALAFFESRGGYEEIGRHLERIRATNVESVRDVARRSLTIENMTLYRYRRTGAPGSDRATVEASIRAAAATVDRAPLESIPIPTLAAAPAPAGGARPIQRFVLSNGAVVFVKETPGTPTVSTSIYFAGGRLYETNRNAGITQLMARALRRGTSTRDDEQIDREIEFLGTQFGISVDEDFFSLGVDILRHHFRAGIELLGDVILHPTFPEEGVLEDKQL